MLTYQVADGVTAVWMTNLSDHLLKGRDPAKAAVMEYLKGHLAEAGTIRLEMPNTLAVAVRKHVHSAVKPTPGHRIITRTEKKSEGGDTCFLWVKIEKLPAAS